MGILIGTDEAGYGPNLGPLVVCASVWQVPHTDPEQVDLYDQLAPAVTRDRQADRLAIADSKQLFRPGRPGHPGAGLEPLERGVLSALTVAAGELPATWRRLWQLLCPAVLPEMAQLPWYADYECDLPRATDPLRIRTLAQRLQEQLEHHAMRLMDISCRVLFPAGFNRLVHQYGSKGTVLSELTLDLVESALQRFPPEPAHVVCDKHGGRDRYAGLLQPRFSDQLVRVHREGRAESRYELQADDRRIQFCFRAKGESFLPSALASMTAKYLRELAMGALNAFWQHQVPGLQATAGYPRDARRFRQQITAAQSRLGTDDQVLWRIR